MGVWSSTAPRSNGRELETLASLALDAVSEPIDTPLGVQLIKRVAVTPREHYAAATIRVRYDAKQPASKEVARTRADELVQALRANPTRFAAVQAQEGCCADAVLQWTRGSTYDEALEVAVSALAIGEITPRPVDLGRYYVIAKRLPLALAGETALSYELPAPAVANTDAILRHTDPQVLVKELRVFKADFLRNTPVAQAQTKTVERGLSNLEQSFSQSKSGEERVAAQRRMNGMFEQQLDAPALAAFQSFRDRWVASRVMSDVRF
jgi:hypothetical protein